MSEDIFETAERFQAPDRDDHFWDGVKIEIGGMVTIIQEECPLSLFQVLALPFEEMIKVPGVYYRERKKDGGEEATEGGRVS